MKNKILIFIFCIITFGLFAIPLSFAKDFSVDNLNYINRVQRVSLVGGSNHRIDIEVDISDFTGLSYWYVTFEAFDNNLNLVEIPNSNHKVYYVFNGVGTTTPMSWSSNGGNPFSYSNYTTGLTSNYLFSSLHIYLDFLSENDLNTFNQNYHYYQVLVERNNANNLIQPFIYDFIPTEYYGAYQNNGIFNGCQVYLKMEGSTGTGTEITNQVLNFATFSFSDALIQQISSNNDRNTYQYYIRFYFNKYIKNMVNFNISYLEFSNMRMNNSTYNTYASSRNALPILYNNIVMYNDNATLFTTDDLVNSGYGDFYIEYIEFLLPNYSFKSSSYYNSDLGINGYISNVRISAIGFNENEVFNNGFNEGYNSGYLNGKNDGFNEGVASNTTGFDNLFFAVGNVPMTILSGILNFEILGFNLLSFFMGIITLLLFVRIVRKFKE